MNINFVKGIVIGVFSPIVLFVFVVVFNLEYSLTDFIDNQITEYNLPSLISLSLLSNLALFFIKIKMNKDMQSRGILCSTILYGALIVYLKFL